MKGVKELEKEIKYYKALLVVNDEKDIVITL